MLDDFFEEFDSDFLTRRDRASATLAALDPARRVVGRQSTATHSDPAGTRAGLTLNREPGSRQFGRSVATR